jgi:hypothetical protein
MRSRLTVLSLAALLCVLPGLTYVPAGPEEPEAKQPAIYALVYVGLAKNGPDNAKRIAAALQELRGSGARGAVRDPKIKALPIVKDKDPTVKSSVSIVDGKEQTVTWIDRDDWAKSKTRAACLQGTAVVRVWFTDGTPDEQVAIVNAIAGEYVKDKKELNRNALKEHEGYKALYKAQKERAGAKLTEEEETVFQRQEWAIKHLPHVIEWANLPEKP